MLKIIYLILFLIPVNVSSQEGWNYLPNAPVLDGRIEDLSFINDSVGWAAASKGYIFKTIDGGINWDTQLVAPKYFRSVEFLDDKVGFAGTLQQSVYKTIDGGESWNEINSSFPQKIDGICGIGHFDSTVIMVGIWSQPAYILRSTDYGETWSYLNLDPLAGALIDCWFKSKDTVFVCGQGLTENDNHGVILRSINGGIDWDLVATTPTLSTYCWKMIFPSPLIGYSSQQEMFGNTSDIMKTIDGGKTWTSIKALNENIQMEGIGFANDTLGWIGGYFPGMYQTTDGGLNWQFYNFGGNFNRFTFLNSELGFASGFSIYKFSLQTTDTKPALVNKKDLIHNLQVSPNPVKDILNIKLEINRSTRVILEIYDVNGKLIKELVNTTLEVDSYKYEENVNHLSIGSYYVVLRTNEHFLSRNFNVIR